MQGNIISPLMKKKINKPHVKQVPSRASGWVDVKEYLPETDVNVLCMMEYEGGDIFPVIRWISGYDDVITDESGFALYPAEVRVVAWMEIPEYNRQRTTDNGQRRNEKENQGKDIHEQA